MISTFTFILFCVSAVAMLIGLLWEWAKEDQPGPGSFVVFMVFWALYVAVGYHGWLWAWGA